MTHEYVAQLVISSIITLLMTVITGLVALGYRDLREQLSKNNIQIHNLQRIFFVLMTKLHPADASIITEEMKILFTTNGNGNR